MKKKYKIADLVIDMESSGRTEKQAKPYLCDDKCMVEFTVCANHKAVIDNNPNISEDDAIYLSTGASFYRQLLNYSGFMLHASAVVVDEKAYLFSANSGTGKSTHTSLWLKYFGERAYILNDDKPALRCINGKWYAYGTPWSGKNDVSVNAGVEVAGIAVLERAEANGIERYTGIRAVFDVFSQTNRPKAYELREKLMNLLGKLIQDVPVWKLKCNMSIEAVQIAYDAMCLEQDSKS